MYGLGHIRAIHVPHPRDGVVARRGADLPIAEAIVVVGEGRTVVHTVTLDIAPEFTARVEALYMNARCFDSRKGLYYSKIDE